MIIESGTKARRHIGTKGCRSLQRCAHPPCLRASVPQCLPSRAAFTLTEMLIVIGIILMIAVLAIPALRVMQGGRSVDSAFNQLTAIVDRARSQALATGRGAGVFFFIDPGSQRVGAIIVEQPLNIDTGNPNYQLDKSDTDSILLPLGVGLQVIDGRNGRYVGYNPLFVGAGPLTAFEQPGSNTGGIILFDGDGKLASRNAVFQMKTVIAPIQATAIAKFVYADDTANPASTLGAPNTTGTAGDVVFHPALGVVLFDQEAFLANGGDNSDPPITDAQESTEETWLHENGTPIVVNRYSGALLRGE